MPISDKNIIEFQTLFREHFGKEISRDDAYENGIKLLQLMSILYRPKNTENLEKIKNE